MENLDYIYYINLSRRTDRNENVLKEFAKAKIPMEKVKRFEAVDGSTHEFTDKEKKMFEHGDFLKYPNCSSLMGNQLSHYYILKEMVEKRYKYIVVMQDDVVLRHNFTRYLSRVLDDLPKDAEMVNIGFHKFASGSYFVAWDLTRKNDFEELGKIKVTNEVCILKDNINPCSLAYIVTLKGAINMLCHFNKNGFLRATDGEFNDYLQGKNIFYGTNTVLCTGDPVYGSDIFT